MTALVIVESPSKAKTIQKYLGSSYTVMASYGHIRDLPSKNGSVDTANNFNMSWELLDKSKRNTDALLKNLKNANALYLATDPDREGEAISWHILELFHAKYPKSAIPIHRVVFNAITQKTVKEAFAEPRSLDMQLVNAYLARRGLDYLVGFGLSPILWRKLPGSRSAGRVQSVALRLICEREFDIETFVRQEYWSLDALMSAEKAKKPFKARLLELEKTKVEKFSFPNEETAKKAGSIVRSGVYSVSKVESKPVTRNPAPPFMTSTLQQEAGRKLGMNATKTMRTAQQLYEGVDLGGETTGLITYMRTDGLDIIPEALSEIRSYIDKQYGDKYLPKSPRVYKTKAKNAQEAHEAIRPTAIARTPESLARFLDADQLKLYTLIWKRAVACQMSSAQFDQKTMDMASQNPNVILRSTGSTLVFDGFLCLYQEGRDDDEDDDKEELLPALAVGDAVTLKDLKEEQHFTEPPPRYTEPTLVKKLEELGIGRPSTYAAIMQVLQDRSYVRLDKKRFFAEERGRLVTSFLKNFFTQYVEYDFTANLEEELDDISSGKRQWTDVLGRFWNPFSGKLEDAAKLKSENVLKALEDELGNHYFKNEKGVIDRLCPACGKGELHFKLGKFGAFISCNLYPDCNYTKPLEVVAGSEQGQSDDEGHASIAYPKTLGNDPTSNFEVSLRKGPYGIYLQMEQPGAEKPKRAPLPQGVSPENVDLAQALNLLSLPKNIGKHPETGDEILVGLGRFGPYLKYQGSFVSIPKNYSFLEVDLNDAIDILAKSGKDKGELIGEHPKDKVPIYLSKARFGKMIIHGKHKAYVPKAMIEEKITLEIALELLKTQKAKK